MKLCGNDGLLFHLGIEGYQFLQKCNDYYDSNWLSVRCRLENERENWEFIEPCLTTFELKALADWLEAVFRNNLVDKSLEFIEPNLCFLYSSDPYPMIMVRFSHEPSPPWLDNEARYEGESFQFPIAINNLVDAIQSLKDCMCQFPERY